MCILNTSQKLLCVLPESEEFCCSSSLLRFRPFLRPEIRFYSFHPTDYYVPLGRTNSTALNPRLLPMASKLLDGILNSGEVGLWLSIRDYIHLLIGCFSRFCLPWELPVSLSVRCNYALVKPCFQLRPPEFRVWSAWTDWESL